MENPAPKRFFSALSLLHWLVIILSLTLTFVAWFVSSRIAEDKARSEFDHEVMQMTEQLRDRMSDYAFALTAGVGNIHSHSTELNREQWRRFSESLALQDKFPGINGIGVIYRLEPASLSQFIDHQRQQRPGFRVYPEHEGNDNWVITYIEPEDANQAAIGLDIAHERNRYTAAVKAMQTGETQITGPIILVQDAERTPGFLFFQPYYETYEVPPAKDRESLFRGLVYAPFIMKNLMFGTLANVQRRVQIRIHDGDTVLYDELLPDSQNFDPAPMFHSELTMPMYGREWRFEIQTTQLFATLNNSRQPIVILICGLLIDVLIVLVFFLLARAKQLADGRARVMTREYHNEAGKLKAVLSTVSEAIITTDSRGFVTSTNPAANSLFGANRKGQPLVALFTDGFSVKLKEQMGSDGTALGGEFMAEGLSFAGEPFPVHVAFAEARVDSGTLMTYTVRDISPEKAAELAKDQFISTVSHELRTPLTAISGAVALLGHQMGNEAKPASRKMLDIISRNTERLSLLVSDLLDIEGFSNGCIRLSLCPESLRDIAAKAISDCSTFGARSGNTIVLVDPAGPDTVMVDRNRIGQVILNLVSNAIKFSTAGSEIRVELRNQEPDRICLSVSNHGDAIPESFREKAFKRFSQVDASDARQKDGTGLGLSICKAIVDLHGGTIDYESSPEQGTTFYFCLSLAPL